MNNYNDVQCYIDMIFKLRKEVTELKRDKIALQKCIDVLTGLANNK